MNLASRISVVVVDGQRTFADALASRLTAEPDLRVLAVSESAATARRALNEGHVDIILLDSELTRGLHPTAAMPRVIMLGPVPDAMSVVEALRSGIAGWVSKEESVEQLLEAIRGVMRGETWLPAKAVGPVLRLLLHGPRQRDSSATHALDSLTPREREVLGYLAEGIGRHEAAERMHLSSGTIRSHVQHLMGKLGVHSAVEAVAVARQAHLDRTPPKTPNA
jgi:DNA-binding NarL/FixJ family response regulator